MQYRKIILGDTIIEFHNSWLGEESVIVNGKLVSRKSSILGTDHHFQVEEQGRIARYVLTTRVGDLINVLIDIKRNGKYIETDILVPFSLSTPKSPNKQKKQGLHLLLEYDLDAALDRFREALDMDPDDPEIHFHMACAYSIKEEAEKGFEALRKAVALNLPDKEMIFRHDLLAYLRMHPAFEPFVESGFKSYDHDMFKSEKSDGI